MFPIIADALFTALGRAPEPPQTPRLGHAERPAAKAPTPRSGPDAGPCA